MSHVADVVSEVAVSSGAAEHQVQAGGPEADGNSPADEQELDEAEQSLADVQVMLCSLAQA